METSQEVLDYVARLPIGVHAGLFYEDLETAADVFSAFMRGGIGSGEQTLFISETMNDLRRFTSLTRDGRSDGHLEQTGFVSLADFCFDGQHLSWKKAKDRVSHLISNADGRHVKGVRAMVLADQCLNRKTGDELVRFEKEAGWSFELPISVLCGYDTRNLAGPNRGDLLLDLCKVHGHLIFRKLAASKA
jgi:hypothetical protein